MSAEKSMSGRMLMGQTSVQSGDEAPRVIDVYRLASTLPGSAKKREVCFEHIQEGATAELIGDFVLGGVHFPEKDELQEITTQFSCKGVSCVLKGCGLIVEQFDADGKKIGEMKRCSD